jgi:Zn-dependent peptidase ImmA (M78 family)/DNA-binding XRE family transcriptional regulator
MMKKIANPKMIILARESREYSQKELADALNVTQGTISKIENGEPVSKEIIDKVVSILNYPKDFFFESADMFPPGVNFYRKHKTLPKRDLHRIAAQVDIQRIHIQKLLRSADITSKNIIELDKEQYETPEEAARLIRENWQIPQGSIDDLVFHIERAGIIVVYRDFGSYKFSAVSKYTEEMHYIIFVNKSMSPDRIRFTLAHELGHIVMHTISSPENEEEANDFASEFLMPKRDIIQNLAELNLKKLARLKRYWKVSMASLIERAFKLKIITERQRRYLWMKMAKAGYKMREPRELDPPLEIPRLLNKLVSLHSNSLAYSIGQMSNLLRLNVEEYNELYSLATGENEQKPPKKRHLKIVD